MESAIADRSASLSSWPLVLAVEQASATSTIRAAERCRCRLGNMALGGIAKYTGLLTEYYHGRNAGDPMLRNLVARSTILLLVATACDQSREAAKAEADAIEQARARAADLANSTQNYQPVRYVSAIEQVARPVTTPKQVEVVKPGKEPEVVEPVPVVADVTSETEPPVIAEDSTTVPVAAPRVPSIVPRDAPQPEAVGGASSGDWRGTDPGPDIGSAIGVVLRGGRGDPGHCPRHPRPPTQIPRIPHR